jgi:molecular chaperone GrpE
MTEDREEARDSEQDSPEDLIAGELAGELPEQAQEQLPEELTQELVNEYSHLELQEQVLALLKDLHSIQKDAGESKDLAQRAQAELSNFRKRTEDDRIALQRQSNSRLLVKMLPVVDELELAVNHADGKKPSKSWVEGVRLIQRKVSALLETEGVTKIDAIGAPFNPVEHEAVGTEEDKKFASGQIIQVVRNGYRLHDRVIQAAQVVVAR